MEEKAVGVIEAAGYEIIDYQPELFYSYKLNGKTIEKKIRPDFLVTKGNKLSYLEVKSGKAAPDVDFAPTRRQLLEYAIASGESDMLLLNMENESFERVQFPNALKSIRRSLIFWKWFAIILMIGYFIILIYFAGLGLLKFF